MYPTGIVSSVFLFSDRALQWLCGTTTDDGGRTAGNFTLLGDLLARMALTTEEAKGFRRPLMLSTGQAQYSEEQLSAQWNIGRKRIRNLLDELTRLGLIDTCRSRVASVMTFPCIRQWTAADGGTVSNPFYPYEQRGRIEQIQWQTGRIRAFCCSPIRKPSGTCLFFSMANARDMWHEAPALSFEICRGITAFGQYYPDPRATVRQTVGLAARRLAPSLLQIPFHDYFSDISYDTRRRYFQTAIRAREALYKA